MIGCIYPRNDSMRNNIKIFQRPVSDIVYFPIGRIRRNCKIFRICIRPDKSGSFQLADNRIIRFRIKVPSLNNKKVAFR